MFGPGVEEAEKVTQISLRDSTLVIGNLAHFTVKNTTEDPIVFNSPCAGGDSEMAIYGRIGDNKTENLLDLGGCGEGMLKSFEIAPGEKHAFDLRFFSSEVFKDAGQYELEITTGETTLKSGLFRYSQPGVIRKLFRAIVSKPLFNLLVFFIKYLPNHSLGISIILLTLVVRILLFGANQKAMKSQYEMQKIQPKLTELKEKYKNNPQMMAMKTMEIYKTHQINPMGSLLPVLAQFPFLIGTYLIISDGVSPHLGHLLYSFNSIDLSIINNEFLWLQLDKTDPYYILPVVVAVVQFITMKLSFAKQKAKKKNGKSAQPDMAQSMQSTMTWVMPLMIGGFTAVFASGIGLYWFTSTLFGAIQQNLVRKSVEKKDKPELNVVKRVEAK